MARLIVSAAVGIAVGYITGSPTTGLQAFSLVYGASGFLDPKQHVLGPKLQDLKAPAADYGAPIAYLIGAPRLAGCIIWASDKREITTTTTSQGKGGPGVDSTVYTYEIDLLVEMSINPCDALRRVFLNGKLVWTAGEDSDSESADASGGVFIDAGYQSSGSTQYWRALRFYGGGPTQLPDPTYEAAVGVGNAPAYRGRATLMVEGTNLGSSGQLPVLTFEVCHKATLSSQGFSCLALNQWADVEMRRTSGTLELLFNEQVVASQASATTDTDGTNPYKIGSLDSVQEFFVGNVENILIVEGTTEVLRIDDLHGGLVDQTGSSLTTTGGVVIDLDTTYSGDGSLRFDGTGTVVSSRLAAMGTGDFSIKARILPTADVTARIVSAQNAFFSIGPTATIRRETGGTERCFIRGTGPYVDITSASATVARFDEELADVVVDLCARTGQLAADDIDATSLAGDVVHAFAISQVSTTRSVLETLMSANLFEWAEGEKLRAVKRGGAPVLTIPYADMGASADGTAEPFPVSRQNDMEIPARVTVTFANILNDFQNGTQAGERIVTESTAETTVELPLGLTPTEAKQLADINTMDLASSMLQVGPLVLTRKYAALETSDVVLATRADGSTLRLRISQLTYGGGVVSLNLVQDDATVIDSAGAADDADNSSTLVRAVSPTDALYLDIPILRDADNDAGFYAQAEPKGDKWSGAVIYGSPDDVTFDSEATITETAIFGVCTTTLGDWTGKRVIDWKNSVTVNVDTAALSSSTRDAILGDQSINAYAIGVDGRWELGQFINATYVSAGVYVLSGLLRGSRGTEWAMTGHASGETFSLLQAAGMRRVSMETTLVGIDRYYRAVSINKNLASATSDGFTDMGVGLKPFSPFDLRASRDPSTSDITLTWQRRTRFATRTIGPAGISIPLGEASEAYSIDVFADGTYAAVKRTLIASSPTAVYTSAQQTADFGSNQSTVYVKVFQLSAIVGRGTELKAAA